MQMLDRLQALLDPRFLQQRLVDPAPQQSATHRGFRAVKQPQERTFLRTLPDRFDQFQITPRKRVQNHKMLGLVSRYFRQLAKRTFLRFAQIADKQRDIVAPFRLQADPFRFAEQRTPRLFLRLGPWRIHHRLAERCSLSGNPFQ
ncbi:hypothetical protein D3C76_1183190 [compost metagenome]